MRLLASLVVGAVPVLVTSHLAAGQGFQGGLRGSLKDAGGVVPGVEVTLTNEQTNIKRSTVTNERGEYVFANVDPGNYGVKATLQGCKTIDRGGIRIGTQQFLTLDLTLEVGAVEESVTVTGAAPLIETANASQGTVLDSEALQTLPAPGRAAFLVGVSIPTVIPPGDDQYNRQQDQTNASLLSLGGGTRRGNSYVLDGVPITDLTNRAAANPSIEALDDVKVQVHTYDAEMGRTGGGVFNTTLKSGTNNWHGTGFFQTRPRWGAANNYFGGKAGQPKPETKYYRREDAANQEYRPVVQQDVRPERRQVGADQVRNRQPVQSGPADVAGVAGHDRQLHVRPDLDAVRIHAADAGDVPLHVLAPSFRSGGGRRSFGPSPSPGAGREIFVRRPLQNRHSPPKIPSTPFQSLR